MRYTPKLWFNAITLLFLTCMVGACVKSSLAQATETPTESSNEAVEEVEAADQMAQTDDSLADDPLADDLEESGEEAADGETMMDTPEKLPATRWDRFRGNNGDGLALDANLPAQWKPSDYQWKTKLGGNGVGSPVVWDDKVFLMSAKSDGTVLVECLNLETGEHNWTQSFAAKIRPVHRQNTLASSTPAVDADHVYVTFSDPEQTILLALDHDGNEVWRRDFGPWVGQHGFAISPTVYHDLVLFYDSQQAEQLKPGQSPGASEVIAVRASDGEDAWRRALTTTRACYALPCVYTDPEGHDQLINCNTGDGFFSLDPGTGKMNWSAKVFDKRTVASTQIVGDIVIGSNGTGGGGNYLVAGRVTPEGFDKLYEFRKAANYVPTPLAVGHLLFLFGDKGIVSCLDLHSGDLRWQKRVASGFSGSPVATAKHVYVVDPEGIVHVIDVNLEYHLAASNPLGEPSRSTPAIVGRFCSARWSMISIKGDGNRTVAASLRSIIRSRASKREYSCRKLPVCDQSFSGWLSSCGLPAYTTARCRLAARSTFRVATATRFTKLLYPRPSPPSFRRENRETRPPQSPRGPHA